MKALQRSADEGRRAAQAAPHRRRGRFAPSPTGPLHVGSLSTALASWLDARTEGYDWLVRIEDLDPPREAPGSAEHILAQLKAHGLLWDQDPHPHARPNGVMYQSDRHEAYDRALAMLIKQGRAFGCRCSRKTLLQAAQMGLARRGVDGEIIYPGFCKGLGLGQGGMGTPSGEPLSWRFLNSHQNDDFVLMRADGLWAYHLAVVIDDAEQGITDIIRGDDLQSSADRHAALRSALGLPAPRLMHVPVMRDAAGEKLSKQTRAPALDVHCKKNISSQLHAAHAHLLAHMPEPWIRKTGPAFARLMRDQAFDG